MPSTKTAIANMALGRVGSRQLVTNLDEDTGREAVAVNTYWDQVLEQALRDHDWGFARRRVELELIESNPNEEWGYSYAYPEDCVRIRGFTIPQSYVQYTAWGIPLIPGYTALNPRYELANDGDGTVIYTDEPNAEMRYTALITDVSKYPADFVDALAWGLAMNLGLNLAVKPQLMSIAEQKYQQAIRVAKANSKNEEGPQAYRSDLVQAGY